MNITSRQAADQTHEVLLTEEPNSRYAPDYFKIRIYYLLGTFVIVKSYSIILHKGSQQNQRPVPGDWVKQSAG